MSLGALSGYFDSLQAIKQSFFPDLFFRDTESGCPLLINVDLECRFIRLRLPAGQSLQLEHVLVYELTEGNELVNVASEAVISVSSVYTGCAHLLEERCLTNPSHKGLGIHTDNTGNDEWVMLDFESVRQFKRIVISNVPSVWMWRAWKLIVESSSNESEWLRHYDHYARLTTFAECASGYGLSLEKSDSSQLSQTLWVVCKGIAEKLCQRKYGEARKLLNEAVKAKSVSKKESEVLRAGFSRLVLQNEQLAWSGHGILRPFVFWSDAEKRRYLEQAAAVTVSLQGISPYVCFGFGAVLGYVRDGDLVPHDDDVDIIIGFDRSVARTIPEALHLVSEKLRNDGYVVDGEGLFSHRWVKVPGGKNLDVFVGLCDGEYISWYPSSRNGFMIKDVFPVLSASFYGVDCSLPKNPVHYLEVTYGKRWRSPDPNFHHPWDAESYDDLNK